MGRFIARQPNGRICWFSTVVDDVIAYNLTPKQYVLARIKRAMKEAKDDALVEIERYMHDFQDVKDSFVPQDAHELKAFKQKLRAMGDESWADFTFETSGEEK